jgi:transposase
MKRFVQGEARSQMSLLPGCLDDFVSEDNPVQVFELFVGGLTLAKHGFAGVVPQSTGRPSYHPSVMLKIYLYGYLNRIPSSRRLERECQRNVELMWLTGRLAPDFKTIANFRKDNGVGIRNVCKAFVGFCRDAQLISQTTVVIDGSKFKGVNNRDRNYTPGKLKRRRQELERSIDRYFYRLEKTDQKAEEVLDIQVPVLKEKIESLKEVLAQLDAVETELNESENNNVSLTDPEARSLRTRGTGIVGYNVQTAVEPDNHLIVAHAVTTDFNDHQQLSPMAIAAKQAMGASKLDAVADRGYFKGEEVLACDKAGIAAYVPRPATSNNKAKGLFDKLDFHYIAKDDEYQCPAGERLARRTNTHDHGKPTARYWTLNCANCALKPKCTTGKERRVSRWEHEAVLDAMRDRLDRRPEMMRLRRNTVEHPFGTLKRWMGAEHFLTKGLHNTGTEMSLQVLCYNLKRVINLWGVERLMEALRAFLRPVIGLAVLSPVVCDKKTSCRTENSNPPWRLLHWRWRAFRATNTSTGYH